MIQPIGIATILLGVAGLAFGLAPTVFIFASLCLFGSAAAIIYGSASIQPAHLYLLFVVVCAFKTDRNVVAAVQTLRLGRPGFWLACLLVYGTLTAYFAPRFFASASLIIPLGASDYPSTGGAVPLGPVSSNLTQTIYLGADMICFLAIVATASTNSGLKATVRGLLAYAAFNVLFAFIDIGTSATGTQYLLSFMRNAQYTFHDDDIINGTRRIIGSWPEASAFAGTTLGALGFTATLWLRHRGGAWIGVIALISLILIVASTSSTGLVAAPVCLAVLYATAIAGCGTGLRRGRSNSVTLVVPFLVTIVAVWVAINPAVYDRLYDYADLLVFSKPTSHSGMERAAWNAYGIQNLWDSWGLGVGLGTARTSSFPVAVLSNVGLPGTLLFGLFLISLFAPNGQASDAYAADIRLSALNGCLCLLVGAVIAGATVDLGLLFFIFAGVATSRPQKASEQSVAS